jgi:hypothetical protein
MATMNARNRFLEYVREGGSPICSPQIGGGAGFDTKIAGKQWISKTTLEDTIMAASKFNIVPLFNMELYDLGHGNPELLWHEVSSDVESDRITRDYVLQTSTGTLRKKVLEEKYKGCFQQEYPVKSEEDLTPLEQYIDIAIELDVSFITEHVRNLVSEIAGRGALCIQWATQPYELLCFPNTVDTLLLANDCKNKFKHLMEKILLLDEKLMSAVAAGGADFVFLGAPASELLSPAYYEEYIIPYSAEVSAMAHSLGLMVYSHICSPIEPFLTMGFYNKMGIDLFETLSAPPVGNVISLKDALEKMDSQICTRGNLGLDILLNATPETVHEGTVDILSNSADRKHIVAASDYLFYAIPEENVRAMAEAVNS